MRIHHDNSYTIRQFLMLLNVFKEVLVNFFNQCLFELSVRQDFSIIEKNFWDDNVFNFEMSVLLY